MGYGTPSFPINYRRNPPPVMPDCPIRSGQKDGSPHVPQDSMNFIDDDHFQVVQEVIFSKTDASCPNRSGLQRRIAVQHHDCTMAAPSSLDRHPASMQAALIDITAVGRRTSGSVCTSIRSPWRPLQMQRSPSNSKDSDHDCTAHMIRPRSTASQIQIHMHFDAPVPNPDPADPNRQSRFKPNIRNPNPGTHLEQWHHPSIRLQQVTYSHQSEQRHAPNPINSSRDAGPDPATFASSTWTGSRRPHPNRTPITHVTSFAQRASITVATGTYSNPTR
ncbi:hypothetical protein ACLOJK_027324, partial [Asimina triloba]